MNRDRMRLLLTHPRNGRSMPLSHLSRYDLCKNSALEYLILKNGTNKEDYVKIIYMENPSLHLKASES
jgi:hypothetical protein